MHLDPMKANAKGQTLTILGSSKLELTDVLVGEVWLCSGQSNMEWSIRQSANAKEEITRLCGFEIKKKETSSLLYSEKNNSKTAVILPRCELLIPILISIPSIVASFLALFSLSTDNFS